MSLVYLNTLKKLFFISQTTVLNFFHAHLWLTLAHELLMDTYHFMRQIKLAKFWANRHQ